MEIIEKRYQSFKKALATLKKSLDKLERKEYSDYQDFLIQLF